MKINKSKASDRIDELAVAAKHDVAAAIDHVHDTARAAAASAGKHVEHAGEKVKELGEKIRKMGD